VSSFDVV